MWINDLGTYIVEVVYCPHAGFCGCSVVLTDNDVFVAFTIKRSANDNDRPMAFRSLYKYFCGAKYDILPSRRLLHAVIRFI